MAVSVISSSACGTTGSSSSGERIQKPCELTETKPEDVPDKDVCTEEFTDYWNALMSAASCMASTSRAGMVKDCNKNAPCENKITDFTAAVKKYFACIKDLLGPDFTLPTSGCPQPNPFDLKNLTPALATQAVFEFCENVQYLHCQYTKDKWFA